MLIEEIKDMAYKDALTGIYNRRYFFEIANKMYLTALRNNKKISLIMCDIDHFKKINDTYGHNIGDIVIKNTAQILEKNIRKNDVVARFGGEEFIVFLYDCNIENGAKIAEKIRKTIENIKIKNIKYTISLGVSSKGNTLEEIIHNADENLYKAKKTRNKVISDKD
jgi:diguanylate cyclase (GGDEF)-like protein